MRPLHNILILFSLTFIVSCAEVAQHESKTSNMNLDNFIHLEQDTSVNVKGMNADKSMLPMQLTAVDNIKVMDRLGEIPEGIVPEPLKDYSKKKIISNAVASRYNLSEVPGHIYKMNADSTFSRVSTQRFVMEDQYPKAETVDKIYYNNKVIKKAALEVVVLIFKFSIGANEKIELIVKDDLAVNLPDAMINNAMLLAFKERFKDNLDDYYFATGATLSSISHKVFKEKRFKKSIAASWITSGGEVYASEDDFKLKSEVALELISLKDMIIIE